MVYTKARLEHAIKVFRQSELYRKKRGLEDTYLNRHLTRALRTITRSSRAKALQTWNFSGSRPNDSDEDEYDPDEERRRLKARKKKKERSGKKKSSDVDEEKVGKRIKGSRVGDAGYVILMLTSPKSRHRLEELSRDRKIKLEYFGPKSRELGGSSDEEGISRLSDGEFARTALRSGRVLQKNVDNKSSDNRSIAQIGASSTKPIELDSSDEEQSRNDFQSNTQNSQPFLANLNLEHMYQPTRASASPSYRTRIEKLETSFAHPINFKLIPGKDGSPECDFCKDWTMAVVGHGTRHIAATLDPQKPHEYHEIAGGHRSEGKEPTQMCVKCSLDRLLVMRCHSPSCQPEHALPINTFANPFSRIRVQDMNRPQSYAYLRYLFCRMNGESHLIRSAYEFPACNLCPQPASWSCRKFQERDHAMRLCQIPNVNRSAQEMAKSAVVDLSTQPAEPIVISLLDSSDDEAAPSSRNDLPATMPMATTLSSQSLRPPLRGCGLHLCNTCHTFVTQSCGGLLPERRILEYLDNTKFGRRADVLWLFKGSLLEKTFEAGRR